jgi:tetratricopeptide (TPR) repeat protein
MAADLFADWVALYSGCVANRLEYIYGNRGTAMITEYPMATTPLGHEAEALYQQGYKAYLQRQFGDAKMLVERSLAIFREAKHPPGILRALHILGNIACEEGQYETARALHEEVLAACREMNFQEGIASSLNNLGLVAGKEGQFVKGCALLEESFQIYQAMGQTTEANAVHANLEALRQQQAAAS